MSALRVLVVDDHPVNLAVVQAFLSPTDVELRFATNGAEAVEAFKLASFDVVLMDIMMPVMDGLTAIKAIREHEKLVGLPHSLIHVLSANGTDDDIQLSLAAGANSHIIKPISLPAVISAVFSPPDNMPTLQLKKGSS